MASSLYGPNEVGAALCRTKSGQLLFGPWTEGSPNSVNVNIQCPSGSSLVGPFHTHPKGISKPSQQDVRSGIRVGAKALCIFADGDLKCHTLPVRRRR